MIIIRWFDGFSVIYWGIAKKMMSIIQYLLLKSKINFSNRTNVLKMVIWLNKHVSLKLAIKLYIIYTVYYIIHELFINFLLNVYN